MAKHLVIMRHPNYDSRTGQLTDHGAGQAEMMARKLVQRGLVGPILSSPTPRAMQAADILARHFAMESASKSPVKVVATKWLDAGEAPFTNLDQIQKRPKAQNALVLVTHEPNMIKITRVFGWTTYTQKGSALIIPRETWAGFVQIAENSASAFEVISPD